MEERIEDWADRNYERVEDLADERPRWQLVGHPERPDCERSGWILVDTGSSRHGERLYSVGLFDAMRPGQWVSDHVGVADETIRYIERRNDWGHGGEEW